MALLGCTRDSNRKVPSLWCNLTGEEFKEVEQEEVKMIKIGQIGIGHNHGEAKMLAVQKFPELFEVVGYAEEDEEWIKKRGDLPGYRDLKRMSVQE